MAEKKDSKEAEKANTLLEQHPDVQNAAGKYFSFDKTPVVRETWPQGDARQPTLNPYEVTGKDLLDLGEYAIGILDLRLLASDKDAAYEDAARRAVNEKDDGRFAGRLNSKMVDLVVKAMEQQKPKEKKPEDLNTKLTDLARKGQESDGKGEPLPAQQSVYNEPGLPKMAKSLPASLKETAQIARSAPALQKITQEARKLSDKDSDRITSVLRAVEKGTAAKVRKPAKKHAHLVEILDGVADDLSSRGLVRLAAELDKVSNTLESQEGEDNG